MSTQQTAPPRPEYGRLYGITHDPASKLAMIHAPRVLKVGIGIPSGRAIQVFMADKKWNIRHGFWEGPAGSKRLVMKTVFRGGENGFANTREVAEEWHNSHKHEAVVSDRPQKQQWFGFTSRTLAEDAGGKTIEVFEPDFRAIEAHGDRPTRIPVRFMSENPLKQEDQYWSTTELKCHGDGLLAERVLSMGSAQDEWWEYAKRNGQKMFTYAPCRLGGCPFAEKECKNHTTLEMQLSYALKLGVTSYFTSTGRVTADNLFSSLYNIRKPLERKGYSIVDIPLELVLSSFKAKKNGVAVQPYVYLELNAAGAEALSALLSSSSWIPAKIGDGPKLISQQEDGEMTYDAPTEVLAAGIAAEFSEPTEAEFEDGETVVQAGAAATATQAKQESIGAALAARKAAQEAIRGITASVAPADAKAEPVVTQPEPATVAASTAAWPDDEAMKAALRIENKRLGGPTFNAILSKHDKIVGTMKFDEPKSLAAYLELASTGKKPDLF